MSTNTLSRAFADTLRSYTSAKQSVSSITSTLLSRGPSGSPFTSPDLFNALEQYRHFRNWTYASIRPIAQRIAGQSLHVGRLSKRRLSNTKRHQPANVEPLDQHEILDLFADPNDLMVSWSLMFTTVASLELTGRQLWWLPKRKQILTIPTHWIRRFNGTTRFTSFNVQPPHSGETFDLPADECVYFSYPSPADPHGAFSPLMAVAGPVNSDESILTSQYAMFKQGIHPSHVIIAGKNPHPDVPGGLRPHLSEPQQRQIITAIRKRYEGVHKHGEPFIIDGLIEDIKRLSNTPQEMDWLDSGKALKSRIMQGFGTNSIINGEIEGANRASATVADQHFCDWTVNPKIELLSQTMTSWFRAMFNDPTLVVWIEPCVPHDVEMKLRWAQLLVKSGIATGDEIRELAPFDLELGNFKEPIKPAAPSQQGKEYDPQLERAMQTLDDAMDDLKSFNSMPSRIAENIMNGNGHAKSSHV